MKIFTKEEIVKCRRETDSAAPGAGDILRLFQEVAAAHSEALGFGRDRMNDAGAAWIAISQHVLFSRLPNAGQKVFLRTWLGNPRFALFPRHYEILDQDQQIIIKATAIWSLLNLKTRSLFSPKDAGISFEAAVTGTECSPAEHLPVLKSPPRFCRTVAEEEIDRNGHMNNAVYADWLEDYLSAIPAPLKSLSLLYKRELRLGDKAEISAERDTAANCIRFSASCGGKTAFCAKTEFSSPSYLHPHDYW